MDLQEQMKESNGEFLSISEAQLQDDLKEDEKHSIVVSQQMNKLAEHFTRLSGMNGYEGDDTSTNFADDGINDIDIEESKYFLNGDIRLKHENETQYTHESRNKHGSIGEDVGKIIGSENFSFSGLANIKNSTSSAIDYESGLSQNENIRKSEVDFERFEIETEKSINSYLETGSECLEKDEGKSTKISLEKRVCKDFEVIKQEEINKADIFTPQNIITNSNKETDVTENILFFKGFKTIEQNRIDILRLYNNGFLSNERGQLSTLDYHGDLIGQENLLFFKGFETIEQNRIDILRLYNGFLSNERGQLSTLDYHGDLIEQAEMRESRKSPVERSKEGNQNIEQYCRRISIQGKVTYSLGESEQDEIDMLCSDVEGQERNKDDVRRAKPKTLVRITAKQRKEKNSLPEIEEQTNYGLQPVIEKNSKSKMFECSSCNYKTPIKHNLEIHVRFHEGVRPYECAVCSKCFVTSSHLKRHILSHRGVRVRNHVCVVCTKRFLYKSHLDEHMSTHTGARPFPCKLCPRWFAQSSRANKHMKTHNVEEQDSKPKRSSNIRQQMLDVNVRQQFKCSICPKKYPYSSSLERHMTSHTGERKFQCLNCSRQFSQLSTLERHRWVHTKEKPYKCSFCPKRFTRGSSLIKHCTGHHSNY